MRRSLRTQPERPVYNNQPTRRKEPPMPTDPHIAIAEAPTPPMATTSNDTSNNGGVEGEAYGDVHKIVLQGIMSAGYLDAKGVKRLFIGACTYLKLSAAERTTMTYVQQVVREINDRIKTYDMAIKSACCELTGKRYYIFLITVEKPIMKLQTLFSPFEIELFQKCMDRILRKYNNFSIPFDECIEITKEIQEAKASEDNARSFMERMIECNYFTKYVVPNGKSNVTLGMRTIREFEPILREMYHDVIANCQLCSMILLHGYLCPKCKFLVHKYCYDRYIKNSTQCPDCRTSWAQEKDLIRRVREPGHDVDFDFSINIKTQGSETPGNTNIPSVETELADDDDVEMPILEPMMRFGLGNSNKLTNNKKSKSKKARNLSSSSDESD